MLILASLVKEYVRTRQHRLAGAVVLVSESGSWVLFTHSSFTVFEMLPD